MYGGSVLAPHPLLEESENFKRILAEGKFRLGYFTTYQGHRRRPRMMAALNKTSQTRTMMITTQSRARG